MQTIASTLSQDERQAFAACEQVISAGLRSAENVWLAFIEIETKQLWREGHKDFKHYCREKWGVGTRRFQQMAKATETVKVLSANNCSLPKNEAQVRPLHALDTPEQKAQAWQAAQSKAASEGQPVTAKHVEEAVEEIKPKTESDKWKEAFGGKVPEIPKVQHPAMSVAWVTEKANEAVNELLAFIRTTEEMEFTPSEHDQIYNNADAALRHARQQLAKIHNKSTLAAA